MVNPPNLKIDRVDEFSFLGLTFNEQLNWQINLGTSMTSVVRIFLFIVFVLFLLIKVKATSTIFQIGAPGLYVS